MMEIVSSKTPVEVVTPIPVIHATELLKVNLMTATRFNAHIAIIILTVTVLVYHKTEVIVIPAMVPYLNAQHAAIMTTFTKMVMRTMMEIMSLITVAVSALILLILMAIVKPTPAVIVENLARIVVKMRNATTVRNAPISATINAIFVIAMMTIYPIAQIAVITKM